MRSAALCIFLPIMEEKIIKRKVVVWFGPAACKTWKGGDFIILTEQDMNRAENNNFAAAS